MNKKFYITTTLPYVNAKPHIGFAQETIYADVLARYHSLLGDKVFFNCGTDEHGQKIYKKALEENRDPQEYVDEHVTEFDNLKETLNLSYNSFTRTTSVGHKKAAQELWKICLVNGFIEKGIYKAKYCVGCELEKQDSELVDGKCPIHPTIDIELIDEENYFFKFSKFQKHLLKLYEKYPDFVVPEHRLKEITNFVISGPEDFSISRLKEKMPWGIPIPNDEKHVMYVWFDALTNYISALGWPGNTKKFTDFWGKKEKPNAIQIAGKDNLRQQSAMWQAMLAAADLPSTRQVLIHGFITSGGQKMSKSTGNVIDPTDYTEKYGTDALRYYLLAKINPFEDSDFTKKKFEEVYNGDLANGLGNLIARTTKLCELNNITVNKTKGKKIVKPVSEAIERYRFDQALEIIWKMISDSDAQINKNELWKNTKSKTKILLDIVENIRNIAYNLKPFLPQTAGKIEKQLAGPKVNAGELFFPRID